LNDNKTKNFINNYDGTKVSSIYSTLLKLAIHFRYQNNQEHNAD